MKSHEKGQYAYPHIYSMYAACVYTLTMQQLETNSGGFSLAEGAVPMPTCQEEGSLGSFHTG